MNILNKIYQNILKFIKLKKKPKQELDLYQLKSQYLGTLSVFPPLASYQKIVNRQRDSLRNKQSL